MNKACKSFHSPHILLTPAYLWPLIFWTSRLWWDKTKEIFSLRVKAVVSLTWTISKNHSRINPFPSTNLITRAIFYLLDSSWASSTIKQNLASPISWRIEDWTFLAKTSKISFWIWCEVYLAFYGAFYPKQEHLLAHCKMLKVPSFQENYLGFFILDVHHAL